MELVVFALGAAVLSALAALKGADSTPRVRDTHQHRSL